MLKALWDCVLSTTEDNSKLMFTILGEALVACSFSDL